MISSVTDQRLGFQKEDEGWFWSDNFRHWQKRQGRVYCYVTPMLFHYQVQLYLTGTAFMCDCEARSNDLKELFDLGESWLEAYEDGDKSRMDQDTYSINNPEGVWHTRTDEKRWYLS
jgi:hypothetical protein